MFRSKIHSEPAEPRRSWMTPKVYGSEGLFDGATSEDAPKRNRRAAAAEIWSSDINGPHTDAQFVILEI